MSLSGSEKYSSEYIGKPITSDSDSRIYGPSYGPPRQSYGPGRTPEREPNDLEARAIELANQMAERDYQRSLDRYSFKVFGKEIRFLSKAKAWLNRSGERSKVERLDQIGLEQYKEKRERRWLKIGTKVLGGFGSWAAITFGGIALTGPVGAALMPTLWSASLREGIDGLMEMGEQIGWGEKRIKTEFQVQTELSGKLNELRQAAESGRFEDFARIENEIKQIENTVIQEQDKNMTSERKFQTGRAISSSLLTAGIGIMGGMPLGWQDYDKGVTPVTPKIPKGFLDQYHRVIWKIGGPEFIYNPHEAEGAIKAAAEVGKELTKVDSPIRLLAAKGSQLTTLMSDFWGATHTLGHGLGTIEKTGLGGAFAYLFGRGFDGYQKKTKGDAWNTMGPGYGPPREYGPRRGYGPGRVYGPPRGPEGHEWEEKGGITGGPKAEDIEKVKEKETRLGVAARTNYINLANGIKDIENLEGVYPEKFKYKTVNELTQWFMLNPSMKLPQDASKSESQLNHAINSENKKFEKMTPKYLNWVKHARKELQETQNEIKNEIKNQMGDIPPSYEIEIKWPDINQIKILGHYEFFGNYGKGAGGIAGVSYHMSGEILINGEQLENISNEKQRMMTLKSVLIHELIHSSHTKNYWKLYQKDNPDIGVYQSRRQGLQTMRVNKENLDIERHVGRGFEEGVTENLTEKVMKKMFPEYKSNVYSGYRNILKILNDNFGIEEELFNKAQIDRRSFSPLIRAMEKGKNAVGPYAYMIISDLMNGSADLAEKFLINCRNASNKLNIPMHHFRSFRKDQLARIYHSEKWKNFYPGIAIPELENVIPFPEKKKEKDTFFREIVNLAKNNELETQEKYEQSIEKAIESLKGTEGIVELDKDIPSIVIPDLHARRQFLIDVLEGKTPEGKNVYDLLKKGKINIVCLGDGMHTENLLSWVGTDKENLMKSEMIRSLGMMKMIMDLKAQFPKNFQYIRGNHDDIMGGFIKYSNESQEVREWITTNFGKEFLNKYKAFEDMLPIMVVGKDFVASHAAPGGVYTKDSILNRDPKVVGTEPDDSGHHRGLTWTDNTTGQTNENYIQETLKNLGLDGYKWIIGHRPVYENNGKYREQFGGQLLQINNPKKEVFAYIPADKEFDPNINILFAKEKIPVKIAA